MALTRIGNQAITLDAAEIPNLPASKITSGTFADARIAASNVSQHATSFDDNKIINDISTLGLRVHTQENLNASNTNSASFDVFQDSSGITNLTNCTRDTGEFIATVITNIPASLKILINGNDSNCKDLISDTNGSFTGGATRDTVTKKFGAGSVKLPDNGYITYGNGLSGANVATNQDYSFDCFLYHDDTYNTEAPIFTIGRHNYSGHNDTMMIRIDEHGQSKLMYSYYDGNTNTYYQVTNAGVIPDNQWFHLAFARQSNTHYLWINGSAVSFASTTDNGGGGSALNFGDSTYGFNLGRSEQQGQEFDGWLDDFRWYTGTNVWGTGSSITVPTEEQGLNTTNATGSFEGATITAGASTSKMGAVITYQDNAGTNTLNTDIILKLSANNGSNYSTATLTALPDFATCIKMAKVNDLSVTAGTQLKYKLEFANQASGSKEARIRGVSLQY